MFLFSLFSHSYTYEHYSIYVSLLAILFRPDLLTFNSWLSLSPSPLSTFFSQAWRTTVTRIVLFNKGHKERYPLFGMRQGEDTKWVLHIRRTSPSIRLVIRKNDKCRTDTHLVSPSKSPTVERKVNVLDMRIQIQSQYLTNNEFCNLELVTLDLYFHEKILI